MFKYMGSGVGVAFAYAMMGFGGVPNNGWSGIVTAVILIIIGLIPWNMNYNVK